MRVTSRLERVQGGGKFRVQFARSFFGGSVAFPPLSLVRGVLLTRHVVLRLVAHKPPRVLDVPPHSGVRRHPVDDGEADGIVCLDRSEERRVGKECRL